MDTWASVHLDWIACGRPDLPAPELALMRLIDAGEASGWRRRERQAHDNDMKHAATRLLELLRAMGFTVRLRGDQPVAGPRGLVEPYLPELRALRAHIIAALRAIDRVGGP